MIWLKCKMFHQKLIFSWSYAQTYIGCFFVSYINLPLKCKIWLVVKHFLLIREEGWATDHKRCLVWDWKTVGKKFNYIICLKGCNLK